MWTETTQQQYRRDSLRYASVVTDEEWALIEGFLPRPRKLGRPRTTEMRRGWQSVVPVDNGLSVATVAQRNFRRSRRFIDFSIDGGMLGCGRRSIILW